MKSTKRAGVLASILTIAVLTGIAQAEDEKPASSGLEKMVQWATKPGIPSLDGLIRPESMEALSGNEMVCKPFSENTAPTANNNSALSDNRAELISRNRLLSGIKFLSDININININIQNSGNDGVALHPKQDKGKKKSTAKKRRPKRNRTKQSGR